MENDLQFFSQRLKLLRKEKKLTQKEMALFLDKTERHYQDIEAGRINIPSLIRRVRRLPPGPHGKPGGQPLIPTGGALRGALLCPKSPGNAGACQGIFRAPGREALLARPKRAEKAA